MRAWWMGFVVGAAVGLVAALAVLERYQWMPYRIGTIQGLYRTDRWTGDMFDPINPNIQAASDKQRAERRERKKKPWEEDWGKRDIFDKVSDAELERIAAGDRRKPLVAPDPYAGLGTVEKGPRWEDTVPADPDPYAGLGTVVEE